MMMMMMALEMLYSAQDMIDHSDIHCPIDCRPTSLIDSRSALSVPVIGGQWAMAAVSIWSSHAEKQEPLPQEFRQDYDFQKRTYVTINSVILKFFSAEIPFGFGLGPESVLFVLHKLSASNTRSTDWFIASACSTTASKGLNKNLIYCYHLFIDFAIDFYLRVRTRGPKLKDYYCLKAAESPLRLTDRLPVLLLGIV